MAKSSKSILSSYTHELMNATTEQLELLLEGIDAVCRDDTPLLDELGDWVADRLDELELALKEPASVVEDHRDSEVTYRSELVKCGKECKVCEEKGGHGPYWYAYQRKKGKLTKTYIGKNLPDSVTSVSKKASKRSPS